MESTAPMGKSACRLSAICRAELSSDPFSGAVFVFRNRRATAIKLLSYDCQGYWLCQKRLSESRFHWWLGTTGEAQRALAAHELQMLLWNGRGIYLRLSRCRGFFEEDHKLSMRQLDMHPMPGGDAGRIGDRGKASI